MDYRRRKQIIIVGLLALALALLGVWVYFSWFYQTATCFDGRQNQKEEGVDCGGPCQMSCELLTVKNLRVEWAQVIFLKDGLYDLAAKIDNINPNYGLSHFEYAFKIFDENGQTIGEKKGSSFSLPGQKKYLIETNVALAGRPDKVELAIAEPLKTDWRRLKDNFEEPNIFVQEKQFQYLTGDVQAAGSAQASGTVKNDSNFDFDKIVVSVVLFDQAKNVIGANKTEIYTVLAGEQRYFSTLWFLPLTGEVKSLDILAETNLFLADNFMRRNGGTEKFQEY